MKLNYNKIEDSAAGIHETATRMRDILDEITGEINKLTSNDTWNSLGSEYIITNYEILKNNYIPIFEELERSILYLNDISNNYQKLDSKIKNEILANLNVPDLDYQDSRIFLAKSIDKKEENI